MLDFLFEVLLEVVCYKTGVGIIYALSFGRMKPARVESLNRHLVQIIGLVFYATLFYGLIYYLKYNGLL